MRVSLWLVYKFTDFSPSSFKLKNRSPASLDKIHILTRYPNNLSYQGKIILMNLTPKELAPCKISYICHCAFKFHF